MSAPALLFGACVTSNFLEPGNSGVREGWMKVTQHQWTTLGHVGACAVKPGSLLSGIARPLCVA